MICGTEKYKYYLSIDGGGSYNEVTLNNYPKISAKPVKDEVFYRWSCDEWKFQRYLNQTVFDALLTFMQNPCSVILSIKLQIRDGITVLYTGEIKINNVNVDEVTGIMVFKPTTIDDYTWWDKDKATVYIADALFKTVTYSTLSVTYSEDVQRVGLPPTRGGMDLCGIDPVTQIYTFAQQRIPFSSPGYTQGNGVYGEGGEPNVTNCPTDLYYKAQCDPEVTTEETLGNLFMRLDDLINYVLFSMGTSLVVSSAFLNDYINPTMGDRNQLNNIVIGLISDIVGTEGKPREITFTNLINILKKYQCYWWVDGNELKIENIKTIKNSKISGIDLTETKFNKYQVLNDINGDRTDNVYNFNIEIPYKEEFSYAEGDDRIGTIEYTNGLVDYDKTTKHDLKEYIADVIKLINFPDSLSDDNYIIVVCDDSYAIHQELNQDGINIINYHLSWDKILNNYWTTNRPFSTGLINGGTVAFLLNQKMKIQQDLTFPNLDSIYDVEKYIVTNMGNGEVTAYELDTENSFIKVTLKQDACS